ncbi:two component transcriptional regulator, LytTR family [Mucilaginibacter lappiensis]|uniref:DNA-binding LytR/AlgR family response regulator n=1 Tax=Mucilaginibacter lappiensis TaxID=354630 RepID=A0ABR6PT51_9SPHI|nr:LytTR family DNA-binding domain-containing protein [Mucilaginibacter lappiensis]MBB6112140.1 DNA-binding LytR/AlgR family response regulator [Mucilaginibacter lappiensis]SIR93864.1 two component transcriptional regulator, LytTR family [Mucilaginibacter lappiensis]
MNIIIIEDELKAARSLENMIAEVRPQAKVIAQLQSIDSSVRYLTENKQPDLIFMDIQLSDGLCFEIFKSVKITCPIIFCTAFDEYSLEAFKANSVDYVLKPFSKTDIADAFKKVDELKNFFQQSIMPDLGNLLSQIAQPAGKKSFLVFKHNKYTTVSTDSIAFFYIRNEATSIMCFDQQEYSLNQSLDQVISLLSPVQFFRLNRQYIVNFNAIKEVEHYFMRKLFVKLTIPTPEKLLINKEKAPVFLNWLENR